MSVAAAIVIDEDTPINKIELTTTTAKWAGVAGTWLFYSNERVFTDDPAIWNGVTHVVVLQAGDEVEGAFEALTPGMHYGMMVRDRLQGGYSPQARVFYNAPGLFWNGKRWCDDSGIVYALRAELEKRLPPWYRPSAPEPIGATTLPMVHGAAILTGGIEA